MKITVSQLRRIIKEEISKVNRGELNESDPLTRDLRTQHIKVAEDMLDASLHDAHLLWKSGNVGPRGSLGRSRDAAGMWDEAREALESGQALDRVVRGLYQDIVDAYYDYENPTWDSSNRTAGVGGELYKLIKYELQAGSPEHPEW